MNVKIEINIEGSEVTADDVSLTEKIKSAILEEIAKGNRTIPERTSLIPI